MIEQYIFAPVSLSWAFELGTGTQPHALCRSEDITSHSHQYFGGFLSQNASKHHGELVVHRCSDECYIEQQANTKHNFRCALLFVVHI